MTIRKATVLGAGVMGSQIAALLVNAGIQVELLDVVIDQNDKNKLSKMGYDRINDRKKPMLYDEKFLGNLSYGNFDDNLKEASDSDLFIEAVKEDIQIKHDIWKKIAAVAKDTAILATNTSGIPIEMIAKVLSDDERARFLGMHFFNPPRFMKLVELIPNSKTSDATMEVVSDFAINGLGKGVVTANDVPAFIANRIGTHAMADNMARAEKLGLSVVEADALTGKVIGRPMGTYALSDLVGLDIATSVVKGIMMDPSETEHFTLPDLMPKLLEKGLFGNKVKQGFYKREGRKKLVISPDTLEYTEVEMPSLPILAQFGRKLKDNLDIIFNSDNPAGKYLWETLAASFYYSALNVPKAANDYKDIDRALVWGFNWQKGPFQLWDLMGFERVKERLTKEYGSLPEWVANRTEPFYQPGERLEQTTSIEEKIEKDLWDGEASRFSVVNTDQLLFKFKTPNNTITDGLCEDLIKAVDTLENEDYSGMVIYSDGPHFSLGANLLMMKAAIEQEQVDELVGGTISVLHNAVNRMRYATKPIATATQGRALGGGAEILLASPFVVAAAESYIGLVEVGVGLIPGGGGLAELAERATIGNDQTSNKIQTLAKVVMNVAQAKVVMNAYEAQENLFLKPTDTIIMNGDRRVEVALDRVRFEANAGYVPRTKRTFAALGTDFIGVVEGQLDSMRLGHFISDYDMEIALALTEVLAGGEVARGTLVNQAYLQSLEKAQFTRLAKNQKTYERIAHMLKTRKPLRN